MKVLEVLNTLRQDHGGPTYSVSHLARALQALGGEIELHILGDSSLASDFPVPVTSYAKSRLGMWRGLKEKAQSTQVLHSHGLWKFTNLASAYVTGHSACRHVISPRGMLAPEALGQNKIRKQIALLAFQKRALEKASLLHATSELEMNHFRSLGFRGPVALIPNGVDIPAAGKPLAQGSPRRILFMGRLASLKRVEELVTAWKILAPERPEWQLHIVGEGSNSYRRKLEEIAAPRTFFEGGVYGKERDEWYRRSEILVLPSLAENFGMVVAEALAHGTPVIASTGTPWQSLPQRNCGWWVNGDAETLSRTLRQATSLSASHLHEMGAAGRAWVKESFGWESVGKQMSEAYRWILGECDRPSWCIS